MPWLDGVRSSSGSGSAGSGLDLDVGLGERRAHGLEGVVVQLELQAKLLELRGAHDAALLRALEKAVQCVEIEFVPVQGKIVQHRSSVVSGFGARLGGRGRGRASFNE